MRMARQPGMHLARLGENPQPDRLFKTMSGDRADRTGTGSVYCDYRAVADCLNHFRHEIHRRHGPVYVASLVTEVTVVA